MAWAQRMQVSHQAPRPGCGLARARPRAGPWALSWPASQLPSRHGQDMLQLVGLPWVPGLHFHSPSSGPADPCWWDFSLVSLSPTRPGRQRMFRGSDHLREEDQPAWLTSLAARRHSGQPAGPAGARSGRVAGRRLLCPGPAASLLNFLPRKGACCVRLGDATAPSRPQPPSAFA